MTCFDDETVLGLLEGRLDPAALATADEHLDDCATCRALVTQLARGTGEGASGIDRILERGHTLGRYVIGDVLGAGAWGRVYSAWEPELDRRVAIKVLRDASGRDRVLREAQAMAKLDHPNVVGVHEVGTADDAVYVAMDLVEGKTLRAWATGRSWRELARAIVEVARGLAAVHAAGIVHRDVKPDNIIIGQDGRARLGDFGLARATPAGEAITDAGAQTRGAGTPVYMAPEILDGAPASAASDQFALGVTAYEIVAGRRPFAGDSLRALVAAHARPVAPPRSGRAWLDTAIARCLARDPAARFASCAALADAIERGLARKTPIAIVAGIATAAIVASGATYLSTRGPAVATCTIDPVAIDRASLVALGPDVTAAVDRWSASWSDARGAACARSIANACLTSRTAELRALLASTPRDADARVRLADAIDAIAPADCVALAADGRDPIPVASSQIAEVERELPAIRAAIALGDAASVATKLDHLVSLARTSNHAPTIAEVSLAAADAARQTGTLEVAQERAQDAFAAALRGHAAQLVAEAAVERVTIAGERRELAVADALAEVATAAIAAAHTPARLATRLARQHALVAYNLGAYARARDLLLAARSDATGAELAAIDSALGSTARAAGDLDEAERRHTAALALDRALHASGAHPDLARDLHNLAGVARLRGALDRATALYTEALAIDVALHGAASVDAGLTHNSLGLVALARGDLDAAQRELLEARRVLLTAHHGDLGFVEHNLGLVSAARGSADAALDYFDRAAAIYATTIGDAAPAAIRLHLDRARALLAKHADAEARASLDRAIALVDHTPIAERTAVAWIADDARALRTQPAAAPTRTVVVEPTEPRPAPEQTHAPIAPVPRRDVGVYGSSQTW